MTWWKQLLTLGVPLIIDIVRESRARKRKAVQKSSAPAPDCRNCAWHPNYCPPGYENHCLYCESLSKYERRY